MSDTPNPSLTPMADSVAPTPQDVHRMALQERLANYLTAMAPGRPIEPEAGAGYQLNLWRAIQFILQKPGSEFNGLWDLLLTTAKQHRGQDGAFNEKYIYRFFEHIKLSSNDRLVFKRLLNLILRTCDPSSRQLALRQIDFGTTLARVTDNAARQKITGYYRV